MRPAATALENKKLREATTMQTGTKCKHESEHYEPLDVDESFTLKSSYQQMNLNDNTPPPSVLTLVLSVLLSIPILVASHY